MDEANQNGYIPPEVEEKKKKRKRWLLLILLLLILAAGVLFVLYQLGYIGGESAEDAGYIIGAGVQELGSESETEEGAGSNGKANISLQLNGRPVFENGESEGNLEIVNPEANVLYMNVEITLNDTGEVIYESGAIPPSHYIGNDKLAKVLEKGEYEATAHVSLFDPENMDAQYNSADFDLIITILN